MKKISNRKIQFFS